MIKKGRYAERVSKCAPRFMAAVLEYLVSEVIEVAGEVCAKKGKK